MLPCEAIEQAIYTAMTTALAAYDYPVQVVPFVADTGEADAPTVSRPCVQVAVDPFAPVQPGATIGQCTVRIEASTSCIDDQHGHQLQDIYELAAGAMTASTIGPLVMSPHLVGGVNDATGEGGISIDENQRYRRKGKTYEVAVAIIGS